MKFLTIREPHLRDMESFLQAANKSKDLHYPWTSAPTNERGFLDYLAKLKRPNQKGYLLLAHQDLVGVFNISEIVHGCFQSAYLGFYVFLDYSSKGYMSQGLRMVLDKVFSELALHRIEANIQPNNFKSIHFVQINGFQREGYSKNYLRINGVWQDHERWALTYEEWLKFKVRNNEKS